MNVKKSIAAALSAFLSFSAFGNNAFGMVEKDDLPPELVVKGEIPDGKEVPGDEEIPGALSLVERVKIFLKKPWVKLLLSVVGVAVVGVTVGGVVIYRNRQGKVCTAGADEFVKEVNRLAKSSPEIASVRAGEEAGGKVGKEFKKFPWAGKNRRDRKHKKSEEVEKVSEGEKVGKNDSPLRR